MDAAAITESVGITLKENVATALLADVEYRVREVIHESKKFMRHSNRSKLRTDDINYALRVKNVEPLYGYTSSSSHRFKMVPHGPQRLYYVEDHEVDLDDIIYGALPAVPLDVTYTAHWLAIDGVQPAIVQNPTPADLKASAIEAGQAAASRSSTITAVGDPPVVSGPDGTVNGEVLVKHVLTKELQMYYEKITESILSNSKDLSNLAVESVSKDPGIQPLLPYFAQFITEKVTKNVRNLEILWSMMRMTRAILDNKNLFVEPYLHQLIPNILTCCVSKRIGDPGQDHHALRTFSAQLASCVCVRFGATYPTLQPRVTKTLLRAYLDPLKGVGTHFGAITGLASLGHEIVKLLIVPNVKAFGETMIKPGLDSSAGDDLKRQEYMKCYEATVGILKHFILRDVEDRKQLGNPELSPEQMKQYIEETFGLFANDVMAGIQYVKSEDNGMDVEIE
ncbi:hypothetical protein HDV05_003585 [Chytridiales sp. JEL 0842]|nr:hypothetical protein HDV05_003585 [Chytridiales sp. JEL 0842]